ncbi:hypothetical protein [Pedobacter caeni]|uniref:Uncharacterized protein n=1 Tax=Pedobacter caeni TaxID=288992 RepID=A0A1M4VBY1_9SPHI|nr:hypothetical protein [Pedobacter caeni]SHE66380.1 hypothetical protein SAMN04488522_101853 [Pedobacter caeni]
MYHSIIPVPNSHAPIVVEGSINTRFILFNAGPANIESQVWITWSGKENAYEPNFRLELRAGSEKIISRAFARVKLNETGKSRDSFAAVGIRLISEYYI